MSVYISLLRGINVGGSTVLPMDTLRGIFARLGFNRVRSYLQSGNVIFESQPQDTLYLAKQIETALEQAIGHRIPVFIRQPLDLEGILSRNPFLNDRHADPSTLHVTFLYQTPSDPEWVNLTPPGDIADEFAPGEQEIYLYCPNGYGKTRLSNSFFERKLGLPVTTRNWNTVSALYHLAIEV